MSSTGRRSCSDNKTLAAGNVVEDHDPVAGAISLDALADGGDDTGGFVSEDAGSGMGAGGDLLEVGATDAAGVDADEEFSGTDLGYGDCLQADIVHAAVDSCLHGRGNRQRMTFDRMLSGILFNPGHRSILDDVGRGFVSKPEDGCSRVTGVGRVCGSVP